MQNSAPTLRGEGRVQTEAEGSGKAGPSSSRQACWEPKAPPKERPPCTERSLRSRHRVHHLIYTWAAGAAVPFYRKGAGGSERLRNLPEVYPADQRQDLSPGLRDNITVTGQGPLPGKQDSSLFPGPGQLPASVLWLGIWVPRERTGWGRKNSRRRGEG